MKELKKAMDGFGKAYENLKSQIDSYMGSGESAGETEDVQDKNEMAEYEGRDNSDTEGAGPQNVDEFKQSKKKMVMAAMRKMDM